MIDTKSILKLWKSNRCLGFDIGATCTKIVQLEKNENSFRLVKTGIAKIPDTLSEGDRSRRLKAFLQDKAFPSSGQIAVNIEDESLLIRRMSLPKMPERDMKIAIRWNFREFLDGPVENYTVNYIPIKGYKDGEKMLVSASCISRQAVEKRHSLMKEAGLRVNAVEPNASALTAAFVNAVRWKADCSYVILDLGDSVSNFVVVGNGCLLFSRTLSNLYGRKLCEQVGQGLKLEGEEAEAKLKEYLADESKDAGKTVVSEAGALGSIGDIVSQFISGLVIEIQRSIDAFCIMYNKEKVDKIYISGGGIALTDIAKRISTGLGVEVEIFNPFQNILEAETAQKMVSAPLYAVAVGLALPSE